FSSERCIPTEACNNYRHLASNEFGRQLWQPIVLTLGPSIFDSHILALDITQFAEALSQGRRKMRARLWRTTVQKPDHRHHRLLRPRRERPRGCCAANQRDELSPLHVSRRHGCGTPWFGCLTAHSGYHEADSRSLEHT